MNMKYQVKAAKPPTPINVNRKPIMISPWFVWLSAGAFYLYEVILRTSPSVMTQGIMDYFDINATHLALLNVFFYYAYVLCQIPSGMLLDKYGPRVVISLSCLLCTAGAIIFGVTDNLHLAQFGRFIIGAGSACGFIACLKLASHWFCPTRFAFIAGLTNMLGTLGATFAGVPLAFLVSQVGWQKAVIYLGYLGAVVTATCWFVIRDRPHHKNPEKPMSAAKLRKALKIVALDKQIFLISFIGGLLYVPITSFAELWGVPFLMNSLNVGSEWASFANTMIFIGMALGSPLVAKLAFQQKSYTQLMKKSAIVSCIFFSITIFAKTWGYYPTVLILLCGGLGLGGQVLCFSVVKELVNNKISGTAMAYTNSLVMLGGMILQPLMGKILDLSWDGAIDNAGVPVYTVETYQHAIIAVPVCILLGWGLLNLCKDTRPTEKVISE